MHLHVYVKRPEAFIGIGRYIKRLIIIIIIVVFPQTPQSNACSFPKNHKG